MPRLILRRGSKNLLEYRLPPRQALVGRADVNDLVVPGDDVSRTHCVLREQDGVWRVTDRSRHGLILNGEPHSGSTPLQEGDQLKVGDFTLVFTLKDGRQDAPTGSLRRAGPPPEQLVASDSDLSVERLLLEVIEGPDLGRSFTLARARQTLGAAGSDLELSDPSLVPGHVRVLVYRGRAILEPGPGATYLDGERVHSAIPVYHGEAVRVGSTTFTLRPLVLVDDQRATRFGEMVGVSAEMQRVFGVLRRMCAHSAPVLLLGESGTGKELAARGLHSEGPRARGPFVALNCASVGEALFESELFGHERGAFTGAHTRRDGAFQQADQGTLFLDELGELPEPLQAKLLRALESGEVRRLGSNAVTYPDVRVVAATNQDLELAVQQGRFRADLYFRLAVLAVRLPPLRERPEDLPVVAQAIARKLGREVQIQDETLARLAQHPFPGNYRELRNVLTRAYVLGGPVIRPEHISYTPWGNDPSRPAPRETRKSEDLFEVAERNLIRDAMKRHGNNLSAIARELGVARTTLLYKIRRYGIEGG